MEDAEVFYLTSNSPLHPENSANDFKVSFNAPFDLAGQKIGLVDATVTKAQSNVMAEKISFKFLDETPQTLFKDFGSLSPDHVISDLTAFFRRFKGELKFKNDILLKLSYEFQPQPHVMAITVLNESKYPAKFRFLATTNAAASATGCWRLDHVVYPSSFRGIKQVINETDLSDPRTHAHT